MHARVFIVALVLAGCAAPVPPAADLPTSLGTGEEAAVGDVLAALTETMLGGMPGENAPVEPPFGTLAVDEAGPDTLDNLLSRIQLNARGSFEVDLAAGGNKLSRTSAEPTTATVVRYTGAGTEPLFGLTTELRGTSIDLKARTVRSKIAEKQGVVLYGGKNLFNQAKFADKPMFRLARESGFGVDVENGTQLSYQVGFGKGTSLAYEVAIASKTLPQVEGNLTLALSADKAAKELTMTFSGPYTIKLPGRDTVLKSGTLDQKKTVALTDAKAKFVATAELLK